VSGLIERLGGMNEGARCGAQATKALVLRQEITEMVLTASLQVDGFLAEIDSETAQIRAVHDHLTDRRDTAVKHSSFGSAVGSAGGALGSTLALVGSTAATAGSYVGAASGAVGAVFGFLGYFQQRGPKGCFPDVGESQCLKLDDERSPVSDEDPCDPPPPPPSCGAWPSWWSAVPAKTRYCPEPLPRGCSPQMLYQLFFPGEKAEFHSGYDPVIEAYLMGVPPNGEDTRRATLIQTWGWNPDAPDYPNSVLKKNEELVASNSDPRKLSIDNLDARANKLADLRSVVSRLNRDLSRLTEDLATGLRCVVP